jgi:PHD/YefM family antitoxin component YafN of YafNO toxin-antitoxin module
MAQKTLSIREARDHISQIADTFTKTPHPEEVSVLRHGKPVMVLVPSETYARLKEQAEAALETQEILEELLQNEEFRTQLLASLDDLRAGRTVSAEEAFKELGW